MDLGLERAGMTCRWQVEIDPFCQKVLAKHWPSVPKYGDIREVTGAELERVDCIAGGFPCQPVSDAGLKLAQEDERWLWPEFVRILRMVRPPCVLVENVPGLLGRGLGNVLGDFSEIGYDAEWKCVSAAELSAPHLRDRLWIVAYPAGGRVEGERVSAKRKVQMANAYRFGSGMANSNSKPLVWTTEPRRELHPWAVEPGMGRVVNGVPDRVDRLKGLGNAVVPQVAEWIGRRIMEANGA